MSRLSSRGLAAALLALCAVPAMPQTSPPAITRIQAMRADGTTAPVDVYNPTGISYAFPTGLPDMILIVTGTNLVSTGSPILNGLQWGAGGPLLPVDAATATATEVRVTVPAADFAAAASVAVRLSYSFLGTGAPVYSNTATLAVSQPAPITLSPTALPNASYGVAYFFTPGRQGPQASGGIPPYTYGFTTSTVFPNNLVYDGTLFGTPAQVGTFTLSMTVTDAFGETATLPVTLTITGNPFAIVTGSPLPAAMVGIAYSTAFTAANAFANTSIVWTVATGGTLPAGLTLSAAGVLSGTPQQAGTYSFGIQATAYQMLTALVAVQSASKSFTLVVAPSNLAVATSALPSGTETQAYSAALSATGGTPPYSWSLQSGALPAGLSLAAAGTISGVPASAGSSSFTAKVTDSAGQTAMRALAIGINRYIPPLSIDSRPPLPDAYYKEPYSFSFSASGGEPPYSWSATGLPPGMTMSANGAIGGSPTDIGTFNFTAVVTDSGKQQASATFPLVVKARPLTITTASPLPGAQVGGTVSITFSATGGVPPYTWAASGGAVPPGTSFRGGALTGSPTGEGDFSFTVQVRDDRGTVTNKAFGITIAPPPLAVATSALPQGRAGQAYSAALAATGGIAPYSWTISGLPSGLSGSASGAIGGTPAQAGTASVTAVVTDAKGTQASRTLDLAVLGPALAITTASPLPGGAVGTPYSQSFAASGGTPPYRWAAVAGYAGSGLSLSSDGVLSGTPGDTGAFTVYVQVTDSENTAVSKAFNLNIGLPALAIATASLPGGTVGAAYSAGVSATGASGAVQWSAGGLPAGLAMDAGGTIAGTPTAPGTATVSVQATDSAGRTATKVLTLAVALPALPAPGFRGVPDTSDAAKQPAVQLGLDGTYPVPITGRITLAFAADGGGDDPTVQFSNGSRTVDFTIPAGENLATFAVPNLAFQTGTMAGTITLQATLAAAGQDITPSPAPVRAVRINRAPPVITRVAVARTATGFDVSVTGYSTTREVSQAIFRFAAAPGGSLQTTDTTLTVDAAFTKWYQDGASRPFGSQFLFTQSFSVQGNAGSIASISVALANSVGRSDAVTANMP